MNKCFVTFATLAIAAGFAIAQEKTAEAQTTLAAEKSAASEKAAAEVAEAEKSAASEKAAAEVAEAEKSAAESTTAEPVSLATPKKAPGAEKGKYSRMIEEAHKERREHADHAWKNGEAKLEPFDPYTASKKSASSERSFIDEFFNGFHDGEWPWWHGIVEVGVRMTTSIKLDEPKRWHDDKDYGFVGTIEKLNPDEQVFSPVLMFSWHDWIGLQFGYDKLSAVAETRTSDHHKDGEYTVSGLTASAVVGLPIFWHRVVPYVEFGIHQVNAEFKAYPWWGYGYATEGDWAYLGKQNTPRNGKRRFMDTSEVESTAKFIGFGTKVYLTRNWLIEGSFKHFDIDAVSHFYLKLGGHVFNDRGDFDIPLSYDVASISVRYSF